MRSGLFRAAPPQPLALAIPPIYAPIRGLHAVVFAGFLSLASGLYAQRASALPDGPVLLESLEPAVPGSGEAARYAAVQGERADGRPAGTWTVFAGELTPVGTSRLLGAELRVPVAGEIVEVGGAFVEGLPGGLWEATRSRVSPGDTAVVLSSATEFERGRVAHRLRVQTPVASLLGRIDADGLATDDWVVLTGTREAVWRFRDGRLVEVVRNGEADTTRIPVFAEAPRRDTLILDAEFFALLELGFGDSVSASLRATTFERQLRAHAQAFADVGEALARADASVGTPLPRVLAPAYPLTRPERRRVDELAAEIETSLASVDGILADETVGIAAKADPSRRQARAELDELRRGALSRLETLASLHRADLLDNLPAERRYAAFAEDPLVRDVDALAASAKTTLTRAATLSAVTAGARAAGGEIASLLTREARAVGASIDSLLAVMPRKTVRDYGLRSVGERADELARQRLGGVATDEAARGTLRCLEELQALLLTVGELPAREEAVEAAYTDEVWNNFTLTVMEERVKRRIPEAYVEKLAPYFRDRIRAGVGCGEAGELVAVMDAAYARVLALREADTEELESDLKRAITADDVLALLARSTPTNSTP